MFLVELQEVLHLGLDLLGRKVFVDMSAGPAEIVRLDLPTALAQRHLDPIAERVDASRNVLVPRKQRVPLLDRRCRQRPLVPNMGKHHVESCLLVLQEAPEGVVTNAADGMHAAHVPETLGDQGFRDSVAQHVQAVDLAAR